METMSKPAPSGKTTPPPAADELQELQEASPLLQRDGDADGPLGGVGVGAAVEAFHMEHADERDRGMPWWRWILHRDYELHSLHELPDFFRANSNHFVLTGYRMRLTGEKCLRSFFHIHNESLNVWTHFGGMVFALVLLFGLWSELHDAAIELKLTFVLYLLCAAACMLGSTAFHLFNCHSVEVYHYMCLGDYSGIMLLISGSFFPGLYLAFECYAGWRKFYLSMVTGIMIFGVAAPHMEWFHNPANQVARLSTFIGMGVFSVVPLTHILLTNEAFTLAPLMSSITIVGLSYALGVAVYVLRLPERWKPGGFDIVGHSHQVWHLFVLLGAFSHYYGCMGFYKMMRDEQWTCDSGGGGGMSAASIATSL